MSDTVIGPRARWEDRYRDRDGSVGEPSAFLLRHLDRFHGRVLDVACGGGRNSLAMARRGLRVDAVDLAFNALIRLRAAARAESLPIALVQADIASLHLPAASYDGVVMIRFLDRRRLPSLIDCVRPGGLFLVETYLVDQAAAGHPRNPDFLLRRGELLDVFGGCEILDHHEGEFDDGAATAFLGRILARC